MVLHQQVLLVCGQAILFRSAEQLSEESDLLVFLLETLSVFTLELGGWREGGGFAFHFQHQVSLD